MIVLAVLVVLGGCSRDPNVRKQKYLQSGNRYFDAGKYNEAIIQYSNAVQIDPRFAEGHYRLAQAYMKTSRLRNAYAELVRTVDLQPDNVKAQLDLGGLLLAGHQYNDARAKAQLVLGKAPDNADAHALLAGVNAGEGKLQDAVTEMQEAIRLAPSRSDQHIRLGVLLLADKQPAEAETSFKSAIELDPKSAQPYMALGNFYAPQRPADAEAQFRKAIEVEPKNIEARTTLARYLLAEGKKDEAEKTAAEAKNALPDDPAAYRLLGDFYAGTGDLDKAVVEFADLYKKHSDNLGVKKSYIEMLLRRNRVDEASKLIDEILKVSKNKDVEALIFRAQISLSKNKTTEAAQELDAALKSEPDNALGRYLRGVAASQAGDDARAESEWRDAVRLRPTLIEAQQALAALAMRTGNMDLLGEVAEQIIKLMPSAPTGYIMRATTEFNRKQVDKAEADLKQAIEIAPQSGAAYGDLGKLRMAQRRFAEGEQLLEQALERDANSIDALQVLAAYYVFQKQPDKAIARVSAQITKSPNNSAFYSLLGSLQASNKDLAGAEASLQKAIELNQNNLTAFMLLGQVQVLRGSTDKALASWEGWAQKNPKDVRAYLMLGTLHEYKNNWQKAQELYNKALQIVPDYPPAANNLAYLMLLHGGNADVALSLAQTAKRGMPDSPNAADTLAWAYYQKGVYATAGDLLREAIKKTPQNPTYHYHLGMVYQKMNRGPEAKSELQRALQLDPKSANADEIRKALDSANKG